MSHRNKKIYWLNLISFINIFNVLNVHTFKPQQQPKVVKNNFKGLLSLESAFYFFNIVQGIWPIFNELMIYKCLKANTKNNVSAIRFCVPIVHVILRIFYLSTNRLEDVVNIYNPNWLLGLVMFVINIFYAQQYIDALKQQNNPQLQEALTSLLVRGLLIDFFLILVNLSLRYVLYQKIKNEKKVYIHTLYL